MAPLPSPVTNLASYHPFEAHRFAQVARFVESRLGIRMPSTKQSFLETRLLRRMRALGLTDYNQYARRLFSEEGALETAEFINAVTTNTTTFFREADHFQQLGSQVLSTLTAGTHRFWSAACSSGEEPYTLAMVLAEHAAQHPEFSFRILATDISRKVLSAAENAVYPAEEVDSIPEGLRSKYLLRGKPPRNDRYRVKPELREHVVFRRLNLMDEVYPFQHHFDAVFCRNVLIYFQRATQIAVLERLCAALSPSGVLFLGHAESITGMHLPLRQVGPSCYRRVEHG